MMDDYKSKKILNIKVIAGNGMIGEYSIVNNVLGIVRIEDKSQEFPDNVFSSYHCFDKDNKIIKIIENCPVDITYTDKDGSDGNN
ncbi:hypothetical protein KAR91_67480 [Candidatus Pacearchaeota archaeon]|nr:hypothetical protein [Candidatus Pacearchaeota archaeon]